MLQGCVVRGLSQKMRVCQTRFFCSMCEVREYFTSSRALGMHMRRIHKIRSPVRCFIDGSTCPVCLVTFSSRPLVIYHLGDARRPKCRQLLLVPGAFPMLSDSRVYELDEHDRQLRLSLAKAGVARVVSSAPAFTVRGRVVGRCTRSDR